MAEGLAVRAVLTKKREEFLCDPPRYFGQDAVFQPLEDYDLRVRQCVGDRSRNCGPRPLREFPRHDERWSFDIVEPALDIDSIVEFVRPDEHILVDPGDLLQAAPQCIWLRGDEFIRVPAADEGCHRV